MIRKRTNMIGRGADILWQEGLYISKSYCHKKFEIFSIFFFKSKKIENILRFLSKIVLKMLHVTIINFRFRIIWANFWHPNS